MHLTKTHRERLHLVGVLVKQVAEFGCLRPGGLKGQKHSSHLVIAEGRGLAFFAKRNGCVWSLDAQVRRLHIGRE